MLINTPLWAVLIIAKLPQMQGVRIFGINSTTGPACSLPHLRPLTFLDR
jgi:hypothetical protein